VEWQLNHHAFPTCRTRYYPQILYRPCHLALQERQFDRLETKGRHRPPPASLSGRSESRGPGPRTDSPAARGGRGFASLLRSIFLAFQTGPPACRAGRGDDGLWVILSMQNGAAVQLLPQPIIRLRQLVFRPPPVALSKGPSPVNNYPTLSACRRPGGPTAAEVPRRSSRR